MISVLGLCGAGCSQENGRRLAGSAFDRRALTRQRAPASSRQENAVQVAVSHDPREGVGRRIRARGEHTKLRAAKHAKLDNPRTGHGKKRLLRGNANQYLADLQTLGGDHGGAIWLNRVIAEHSLPNLAGIF